MLFNSFSISHVEKSARDEARQVILSNLAVSFLPLVVSFVVLAFPSSSLNLASIPGNAWTAFRNVFLSGQLYFFAMAICGTVVFLVARNGHEAARWMRVWSIVFVLFCVAFMVVFITQNPTAKPSITVHSFLSLLFFVVAVVMQFRVTLLSEAPPRPPEESNRQASNEVTVAAEPSYD